MTGELGESYVAWLGFRRSQAVERAARWNAGAGWAAADVPNAPRIRSFEVERRWLVLWCVKVYERSRA